MTLHQAYLDKGKNYKPRTKYLHEDNSPKFINNLILESSPYLLQHAHNPVNWHSFKDATFAKATKENKLVFISIGYATCHWCHVMEEESFDDIKVADIINKHFISIKVDREIRPDIDANYMNTIQLINGSGGWPLNAITLADGKVFFIGTYFPKNSLINILSQIQNLWQKEPNKITNQANRIENAIKEHKATTTIKTNIDKKTIANAINNILFNFDKLNGGFGKSPKFPHETMLLMLIDKQKRQPNIEVLNAINTTLKAMAKGGFYDVVEGGFHRYATDDTWLVPHFEKMLYNQSQLALVYTRAYRLTKIPLYKRIAKQTLDYVLAKMQHLGGGFFSATDADSAGKEGSFFVWSITELKSIFTNTEFKLFNNWFDLSANTNFENSNIIRYLNTNNIDSNDYDTIDKLLNKLHNIRNKRESPLIDNKLLLSWNALLIPSFIEAGRAFVEDKYLHAALKLANYLHTNFNKKARLYRTLIDSKLETYALAEDYAYLINAYISIFDQTNKKIWLDRAVELTKTMNQQFWDEKERGFNIGHNGKYLNNTYKEFHDGATPATNGLMYNILVKLYNRAGDNCFNEQRQQLLNTLSNHINKNPADYSSFILGFNNATYKELAEVQYIYEGRVRIHTKQLNYAEVLINIKLPDLWYINSNKPLDNDLIATKVTNIDNKNWTIITSSYPPAKLLSLSGSTKQLAVYQNNITINIKLKQHSDNFTNPHLQLSLQACNDKECLNTATISLKP